MYSLSEKIFIFKNCLILLIFIVILFLFSYQVITINKLLSKIKNNTSINPEVIESNVKTSCDGDGFTGLNFISKYNKPFYLKYKILDKDTFESSYKKCKDLDSNLWQILQGEPEYNAMFNAAKNAGVTDMWIDADPVGDCPGNDYYCLEDEAAYGKGIQIRYPLSEKALYSRLYAAPSTDMNCIYSEDVEPYLWETDSCKTTLKTPICVKRNCIPDNTAI